MNAVKVIAVSSGKGGVGKTNVSVNLACQLARRGNRVLLMDADLGLANVDIMLGLKPKWNLWQVLNRRYFASGARRYLNYSRRLWYQENG
jgi:flagellar biosynthesis protein FlhG